ncbi:MAG: hypothetical protein HZB27_08270, partial [Meiothermus silvanus]|nr:hypothetical protein [Allomeiothermus silvanus]
GGVHRGGGVPGRRASSLPAISFGGFGIPLLPGVILAVGLERWPGKRFRD